MANKSKKDAIAKSSPFAAFETNPDLESEGIKIDYGAYYFIVGRAGGANTKFRDIYREKTAAHKRAIVTETLPDDIAEKLSIETFAEATVFDWGSEKYGEGKMEWRDGSSRDFSTKAVIELFQLLPDLARDLMAQSQNQTLFRRTIAEIDAGN